MVGLRTDYTQAIKEYIPKGQNQTLWEQFFTGAQKTYQGLTQQTQDVYAYDISQAYANYKQQQLKLQMNDRLGTGFKQQVGSQLQSEYDTEYQNIRTEETASLDQLQSQYESTLQEGSEQFVQMGEQLRNYDKLIHEWAELTGVETPENMTRSYTTETGENVTELTDYGKLWYSDVLGAKTTEGMTFDQWLESEEFGSEDIGFKDRETLLDAYRQNPELFKYNVAGLTTDFNAEEVKTKLAEEEKTTELSTITQISDNELYQNYISKIGDKSAIELQDINNELQANDVAAKFEKYDYYGGHASISNNTATDITTGEKYTNLIQMRSPKSQEIINGVKNLKQNLTSGNLNKGDIIIYKGEKYVIDSWTTSNFGKLEVNFRRK